MAEIEILLKEEKKLGGHLRLFFGMVAGVGKTCAMLKAGQEQLKNGIDVCIGFVETHGRLETQKLIEGLPIIPRKKIEYRGTVQEEMDLDAVLSRKPKLVLVDELAHTNVPGSRHEKRYQDVVEILRAGIDVYSTMNVQHLESRSEIVQLLTGVQVREMVPDSVLDFASQIELIDLTPAELIKRLQEGKIYPGRKTEQALKNFFQEPNLNVLREMSLRVTADKVDRDASKEAPAMELPRSTGKETPRLMVALGAGPSAERLVRAARRIADMLQVPWVALHVDTGATMEEEEQNQLVKSLNLAEELGAQVMMIPGSSVVEAISDYADSHPVLQLILGGPNAKGNFTHIFKTNRLIHKIIKNNPTVDVSILRHAVEIELHPKPKKKWFAALQIKKYFIPAVAVVATTFLNRLLVPHIGYRAVGFVFLLLVSALSFAFPLDVIVTATLASALLWNYFFIPPTGTFTIQSAEDATMFLAFLVIAFFSGFMTFRIRRHQKMLKEREEKMRAFYEILKGMTLIQGIEGLIRLSLGKLENLLKVEACILLASKEHLSKESDFGDLKLEAKDRMIASWSLINGKIAGWSTDTLPDSKIMCLCLKTGEKKLGILAIRPKNKSRFTPDQQDLLFSIANTIAAAMAKRQYDEESQRAHLLQESEKLHQTLLHSISHELRTPLTTILGAATTLRSQKETLQKPETEKALLDEIVGASRRLNHVFDNLLDMSRLESGAVQLQQEWFDMVELVRFTLDKLKESLAEHPVPIQAPSKPVYCFGDFDLLSHAFSNLLVNAAKYSPAGRSISINIERIWKEIWIHFEDQGSGIPKEEVGHVFEKFYRLQGTPTGGLGLGLAITKNIIELHKGRMEVINNAKGGATFSAILPYQDPPKEMEELIRESE